MWWTKRKERQAQEANEASKAVAKSRRGYNEMLDLKRRAEQIARGFTQLQTENEYSEWLISPIQRKSA